MQCTNPIIIFPKGVFPCGKCLNCRIAKSREWSSRLICELPYWSKSVFVTLTYSEKFLPKDFGLHKEHLQLFIKRLRKQSKIKLKYFACGEYGDENIDKKTGLYKYPTKLGRPHYHLIIFGLGSNKQDRDIIKSVWRFCEWSNFRDDKAFGTVTYDSCRYVSDYIFKKYDKQKAKEVYKDVQIPFRLCSQGLGLQFALDNKEQLQNDVSFSVRGVRTALPRYFMNKLDLEYDRTINKDFEKWQNYCRIKNFDNPSEVYYEHMKQRELNTQKNADVHKKGKL